MALESAGVYWKPVWNALERTIKLVPANPHRIKNITSQKTGRRDAEHLSFKLVPDRSMVQL